jgi:hypothetical protein
LGSLADAPVNDRKLRILVDVIRIKDKIFDSDVEIRCCILVWVLAVN